MGYPIRINICHWERSNAENPDTESVVSKMEITAAYGKGFTARSILKLLATDSKIQSGQRQISRYVKRHICFLYPFQNFPYVFVLFHNYDLFFMPYGPRLPCFRFCGLYFRGAGESDRHFRRPLQHAPAHGRGRNRTHTIRLQLPIDRPRNRR